MRASARELWQAVLQYGEPSPLHEPVALRRKNRHLEQGLLNAVLTVLRTHPKVAWAVRMNSGAYKTPDGRFVRYGFSGCPDIIGMLKGGRFLAIECKSPKGRATEEQLATIYTITSERWCVRRGALGRGCAGDRGGQAVSDEHYREIYGPGLERVLESIGADIDRVANAITPFTDMPGHDETGGTVGSLTEAVMGITAALVRIAHALEDVAGAVREGRE